MDILAFSPFIFTSESVPYPTCDIKSPQTSGLQKGLQVTIIWVTRAMPLSP